MPAKKPVSLRPEIVKRIAKLESMGSEEITKFLLKCMEDLTLGKITAKEGTALNRAAGKRLKAIRAAPYGA